MTDDAIGPLEPGPFVDLIFETDDDWSYAAFVLGIAYESGLTRADEGRQLALGIMIEGIVGGVFVPGDVHERHQPWPLTTERAIERILQDWPVDLVPGLGDVTWLDLTAGGRRLAAELEHAGIRQTEETPALPDADITLVDQIRTTLRTGPVDAQRVYSLVGQTGLRTGSEIRQLSLGVIADLLDDDSAVVGDNTNGQFTPWGLELGESLIRISERWTHWGPTEPEPGTLFGLAHRHDA